jgi:hypothetical protein
MKSGWIGRVGVGEKFTEKLPVGMSRENASWINMVPHSGCIYFIKTWNRAHNTEVSSFRITNTV